MRLKKVISGLVAVAMAATFASSAFAATAGQVGPDSSATPGQVGDSSTGTPGQVGGGSTGGSTGGATGPIISGGGSNATPGQIAGSLADAVLKNPYDYAGATKLVATVNGDKSVYVTADITNAMAAALRAQGKSVDYDKNGVKINVLSTKALADQLVVNTVTIDPNCVVFDADYVNGVQSELGTYVTIQIPYNLAGNWAWTSDNGQSGVAVVANNGTTATLSFFAPHFSRYTLTPASTTVAPGTSGVIKSTGADMNTIALGIVGTAVLAGAGVAFVSVKKRALSK